MRFFWKHLQRKARRTRFDGLPDLFAIRRFRPLFTLPNLSQDAKASLNVSLLAIPQGMAYATIAGLPIVNGILCSAVAALVAPLFASSRFTILGPTNATSFMLFSSIAAGTLGLAGVPFLVILVGLISIAGAYLKLADLLQFISRSVLVGYITGAATLIIVNQLKPLLGISQYFQKTDGRTFPSLVAKIWENLPQADWQPAVLGGVALTTFLLLQKSFKKLPNFALTLLLASLLAALFPRDAIEFFADFTLADLSPSLPQIAGFNDLLEQTAQLLPIAFALAFLASLENTAMSKSLASQSGDRPDVNQDMFSVGMANLAASCLAAMPASGSLVRSTLNYNSGARTPFASIFSGLFCLGATFLLATVPIVSLIPKSVLAGLVIAIAISLISIKNIRVCLRSTRSDALVLVTTFLATLLTPLHVAIFIGVALSIALFLRKAAVPQLVEYAIHDDGDLRELGEKRPRPNPEISIVHVEGDLFFGAAELFRSQIQRIAADANLKVIILRLKNARHLDATSVLALADLIKFMRDHDRHVLLSGTPRPVYRVLKNSGVLELLQEGTSKEEGTSNIFMFGPSNPNISTRNALRRAQQLLGDQKADISIFHDANKDK
ncbi:SulP family inorganic anion transporter [Roseibacillus ishigakijimensis]|uniref:SulP family inorganic anion transporter n=1 Tax=Roseibacillus ishigakijimensis TaxID=454146 RepID=A0A934RNE0_9BACT|nr:SulP family inorganic anion transporter [Roseibacillus ishigakijimensis]MBK1832842.1 SulP family inorganic anion transporter [Roseibacillus ishigakijimensis]